MRRLAGLIRPILPETIARSGTAAAMQTMHDGIRQMAGRNHQRRQGGSSSLRFMAALQGTTGGGRLVARTKETGSQRASPQPSRAASREMMSAIEMPSARAAKESAIR